MVKRSKRSVGLLFPKIKRNRTSFFLSAVLFMVIVFSTMGFIQNMSADEWLARPLWRNILDGVYQSIMLLALNPSTQSDVQPVLEGARWIALGVSGYVIYRAYLLVIGQQFVFRKIRNLSEFMIICGLNQYTCRFIDNYLSVQPNAKQIVVIEPDSNNDRVAGYKEKGLIVVQGKASDPVLLKKVGLERASQIFVFTEKDEDNINIALNVYNIVTVNPNNELPNHSKVLDCYVNITDEYLQTLYQEHTIFRTNDHKISFRIISLHDIGARQILNRYPPDELCGRQCHLPEGLEAQVVIVGLGAMGRKLAYQVLRLGHYANFKRTMLTLVDRDAEIQAARIKAAYPGITGYVGLHDYNLDLLSIDDFQLSQICPACSIPVIYVCLEDDALNCLVGRRIAEILANKDNYLAQGTTVICLPEKSGLAGRMPELMRERGQHLKLEFFNTLEECCRWDVVVNSELDRLAKDLHEDYLSNLSPQERARKESGCEWRILNEEFRNSSRLEADFLLVRQRALLKRLEALGETSGLGSVPGSLNNQLAEVMAHMEHVRWLVEKIMTGWRYGEVTADARKINCNMVSWDSLKTDERYKSIWQLNYDQAKKLPELFRKYGLDDQDKRGQLREEN